MKITTVLGAALCFGLLGPVAPAHATDPDPSYVCVFVNHADDGTLTGTRCEAANGGPTTGQISQPFVVWTPFRLTRIIVCTNGQANLPAGVTASGCQRFL